MRRKGVFEVKARKGLIRIEAVIVDDIVETISISGDFFLYPEDALWMLEEGLKGINAHEAVARLRQLMRRMNVRLVGSDIRDFEEALRGALREAEEK